MNLSLKFIQILRVVEVAIIAAFHENISAGTFADDTKVSIYKKCIPVIYAIRWGKPANAEWAEDRKESYMAQVSRSVEIIAEDHYRFSLAN